MIPASPGEFEEDTMDADPDAERIGRLMQADGRTIAVAESLTGGELSARLAVASDAGEWYRGAVVAYSRTVKHDVLGVSPGPVVSARAAAEMARCAAQLLEADVAVAVTGVGGPDPQDDRPPGTVYVAVHGEGRTMTSEHHFDGEPADIVEATCHTALEFLAELCEEASSAVAAG